MNKKMLWTGTVVLICCLMALSCRVRGSAERAPVHIHSHGCGHYQWHGAWHDVPHPPSCSCRSRGIELEGRISIE